VTLRLDQRYLGGCGAQPRGELVRTRKHRTSELAGYLLVVGPVVFEDPGTGGLAESDRDKTLCRYEHPSYEHLGTDQ
jgi:hypothetical protein